MFPVADSDTSRDNKRQRGAEYGPQHEKVNETFHCPLHRVSIPHGCDIAMDKAMAGTLTDGYPLEILGNSGFWNGQRQA